MKYLILLLALSSLNIQAEPLKVIARDQSMNLSPIQVSFDELGIENDFEHFKYFNIVKGTNEEPQSFNRVSEQEKLRVLTLGYHLTKAREYFSKILKTDYLNSLGKITVRYDMAKSFSTGRHFTTKDNEYNNAVSHKASNNSALDGKKWGNEIWFRPALEESKKSANGSVPVPEIQDELLNLTNSAIIDATKSEAMGLGLYAVNSNHYAFQLGLLVMMKKVIPTALDIILSAMPMKMKLDSAMVPEIIYHEFTHIALSDVIPLTGSFAVTEAYANYFASVISGNDTIAAKLGEYGSNIQPIELNSHLKYNSHFESNSNLAHHPFTYNYLWTIRIRVAKEITIDSEDAALMFDRIVFESRKYLDLSSELTISKSLPEALMKASSKMGLDKMTAREVRLIISQSAKNMGM